MSSALSDVASDLVAESSSSVLEDLRVQAQQLNWLQSRFKILVSEAVRTQESLSKCEESVRGLQISLVSGVEESMSGIKSSISVLQEEISEDKKYRINTTEVSASISELKNQLDDIRFAGNISSFQIAAPSADDVTMSLEKLERSIATLSKVRTSDVNQINQLLAILDNRLGIVAANCCCNESGGLHSRQFEESVKQVIQDVARLSSLRIPDIEETVAAKMRELQDEVSTLRAELRQARDERELIIERSALKDAKLAQMLSLAGQSQSFLERSEKVWTESLARIAALESEISSRNATDAVSHQRPSGSEERLELLRAESRASSESLGRRFAQEIDGINSKLDKLMVVRDEYGRLSEEIRGFKSESREAIEALRKRSDPVVQSSFWNSSALLKSSTGPTEPSSELPQSIASSKLGLPGAGVGSITLIGQSAKWEISDMSLRLLTPNQFPKYIISPPFDVQGVQARMKLFPLGSEQSKKPGWCSLYLRCPGGTKVRFNLSVNGEDQDVFDCLYDAEKDKGKHDFCEVERWIRPDGGVSFGAEIVSVSLGGV